MSLIPASPALAAEGYKAAVATAVITPSEPTWLGGYGSRTEPATGKVHDLNTKALVIQDAHAFTIALITLDTENVPRAFADGIAEDLHKRFDLTREQIVISCSHTHCGPALAGADAQILYPMTPEQYAVTERYTNWLRGKAVEVVGEALSKLAPAELSYGRGECGFGVNRRTNREAATSQPGFVPVGPVDHDVPVLCVRSAGKIQAVLFGYACHCTTMNFRQWCGDYAGFAKIYVEEKHTGATALFMAGCGADTNPLPRRKIELCQKYGRQLADAVEAVVSEPMRPVRGPLRAAMRDVELAFDKLPTHEELEQTSREPKSPPQKRWAGRLLNLTDAGKPLPSSYAFPVQVLQLGDGLTVVVLGGETVVDYSLRLKRELGLRQTWVFAYANDLCAYMPSERVLKEGGYEGHDAMVYYGHPSAWAPGLEEKIIATVHALAGRVRSSASTMPAQ